MLYQRDWAESERSPQWVREEPTVGHRIRGCCWTVSMFIW